MSTLIRQLKQGEIPEHIGLIAASEKIDPSLIVTGVINGKIAVPKNNTRALKKTIAIGDGLRTKINANIGTSLDHQNIDDELKKLDVAEKAGTDTVMDLSTGGNLDRIRKAIIDRSSIPLGTVPLYQVMVEAQERGGSLVDFDGDHLFQVIERQAKDGVDFMTVHSGVNLTALNSLNTDKRVADVVSRGGALMVAWMIRHERENPLFQEFDTLLEIARKYDITLSLGDGMRPGCLADADDRAQTGELMALGRLVERSRKADVQVIVEGPGHMAFDKIEANVKLEKDVCGGAPYYVLGPLVTDVAAGHDHITAAIGGTMAAVAGADFLCYVTPKEHLGLPTHQDVHDGVIASRIAAHAADIVKKVPGASQWDLEMAKARKSLDWQAQQRLALDPEKAKAYYEESAGDTGSGTCTMCSDFCAMKLVSEYLGTELPIC